jgi:prepilin-type N-terminal cleavage/methylation domain-containing protein
MDRCAAEDGFTLVELMVGVALASVLAAATFGSLVSVQRALEGAVQRNAELGRARVAVNQMERQFRGALRPPTGAALFQVAAPNEAVFYTVANSPRDLSTTAPSSQGPIPRRVRLWVEGGALREQVTQPVWNATLGNWAYPATPGSTRVLADDVVPPEDGVFTYHCSRSDPGAVCADPAAAVAVTLNVRVRLPGGSDATLLTTRARLVNLELQ